MPSSKETLARFLTTGFGLGRLPVFPGTWGSLLPLAVAAGGLLLPIPLRAVRWILVVIAVFFSWATIRWGRQLPELYGAEDPREVVSDEIAGQAVALLAAGDLVSAAFCFAAFRFFDVVKVWPICRLERLPGGYGVLADDLAAGVAAGLCVAGGRALLGGL